MVINKKSFYLPVLLFLIVLVYYLAVLFPMTSIFSFENDLGSHIARLFFFEKHGYSGPAPEWYEGFKPFELYPPGIFFFLYAVNSIVQDSLAVWYVGLVLILLLGFCSFLLLGKIMKISMFKSIAAFMFFFANPLMILNIVKFGRYPEVFGWLVFVLFCCGIYYFKENKINWLFVPFIISYAFLMLAYIYIFVVASLLMLSLFLIKKGLERLFVVMGGLVAIASTFFWWKDFLYFRFGEPYKYGAGLELLDIGSIISFNSVIIAAFLILMAFYIKHSKTKRYELLFYLPLLAMAALIVLRLLTFVPILNNVPTNIYSIFYLFTSIILLMKTDFGKVNKIMSIMIIIVSIVAVAFTLMTIQPHLRYSKNDAEFIDALSNVEGRFMLVSLPDQAYSEKLSAYGSVFYNIHTPSGFYLWALESKPDLNARINNAYNSYNERSCGKLKESLKSLYLDEFFVEKNGCSFVKECGFALKKEFGVGCLLKT